MTSSDSAGRALHAVTIGPAAWAELQSRPVVLRVHSVFPSALNLAVSDREMLIAITGSAGWVYPHAIAVEESVDFMVQNIDRGALAVLRGDALSIGGTRLAVDLTKAERRSRRSIPAIRNQVPPPLAARLAAIQASGTCDLRIDEVFARRPSGIPAQSWANMVSSLIGFGRGLTPAGDDFVCGLLAAAHARGDQHLLKTISTAVESNLQRTSDISASLMRLALRNDWLEPLIDLAFAVARAADRQAFAALEDLCSIGHSSGADIATGFLFGLHVIPSRAAVNRGHEEHRGLRMRAGSSPKERSYL